MAGDLEWTQDRVLHLEGWVRRASTWVVLLASLASPPAMAARGAWFDKRPLHEQKSHDGTSHTRGWRSRFSPYGRKIVSFIPDAMGRLASGSPEKVRWVEQRLLALAEQTGNSLFARRVKEILLLTPLALVPSAIQQAAAESAADDPKVWAFALVATAVVVAVADVLVIHRRHRQRRDPATRRADADAVVFWRGLEKELGRLLEPATIRVIRREYEQRVRALSASDLSEEERKEAIDHLIAAATKRVKGLEEGAAS